MQDKISEVLNHQRRLAQQKFYVSFDDTGRIVSVFVSSDEPKENTLEIDKNLAEDFLNGSLMKTKYRVAKLGDKYQLEKNELRSDLKTSSSFYKAPNKVDYVTITINKAKQTATFSGKKLDDSSVFYFCAKNCFHKLYKSVVYDTAIEVYSIDTSEDVDVFIPSHVPNVGVQYE